MAFGAAVIHRLVEFFPTRKQVGVNYFKRIGRAVDIDEHRVKPDVAADLREAKVVFVDRFMRIVAGAADVRGADEFTSGGIAP